MGPERVARILSACSRPTTRGTATCRRFRCTPTRPTTSPRSDPPPSSTPTSAVTASTASRTSPCPAPSRSSRWPSTPTATRATPARTRSRSTRRSRAAARATATCSPSTATLQALRALRRAAPAARLDGRIGRRVRPPLQRAAARGLDLGRRRRAADLPRPRPLRRGRRRRDRPRAARSPFDGTQRRVHPPRHALRVVEQRTRTCRRWGCACGSKASYDISAVHRRRAGRSLQALKTLRDDRRRQRLATGSSPAPPTPAGTTTT